MNLSTSPSLVGLLDVNIAMYAAGAEHRLREPCARIVRMVLHHPDRFVTDSEVFQEILHRYRSAGRWALGREVFDRFARTMRGRIEPVYVEDVLHAARLADDHPDVSSRDLVHAAVALRLGAPRIVSADADFDRIGGVTRLAPERVDEWADALLA